MRFRRGPKPATEISTRGLIEEVANGPADEELTLGGLLDRFSERAYGAFLLFSLIPAIVPGGGAIGGPLICLLGAQLVAQKDHPWLPDFIARRPLSRDGMRSFHRRTARLMRWLETVSKPRTDVLIEHPFARALTGLLLVLLGALLALPLPATNWVFGAILLGFAIALIERDGRLMAISWIAGIAALAGVGAMSGQIAAWLSDLF